MQRDKIDHLMAEMGHLRRGHVDGMSAIAPIATELLREGNGRKGPLAAIEFLRSKNTSRDARPPLLAPVGSMSFVCQTQSGP